MLSMNMDAYPLFGDAGLFLLPLSLKFLRPPGRLHGGVGFQIHPLKGPQALKAL